MSSPTHIGIIGCGKQAEKHITSLQKLDGIAITVADIDAPKAQALAERFDVSIATIDELMENQSVQAVAICTPTPTHMTLIKQAVIAGKEFFCEKPLCASVQEAETIAKLCKEHNKRGLVGYIYRYSPLFQMAHGWLQQEDSSPLGKPVLATLRIGGRGSHQLWKHQLHAGGGVMNEMLVHMLDIAQWLFGEVKHTELLTKDLLRPKREIQGSIHTVDAEDFAVVQLTMQSGMRVLIQSDLVTPGFSQHIEIQGEQGSFMGSIQPDIPARLFCAKPTANYQAGWNNLDTPRANLLDAQMEHFVHVINDPALASNVAVSDSIALLEMLEQLKDNKRYDSVA